MITSEDTVKTELPAPASFRWAGFKLHPALRDFAVTGLSSLLVTLAAMVVISILGRTVGAILLGEYLLIRRMASWIQAGVQMPSGVALPRFVAFCVDDAGPIRQAYFLAALLSSVAISLSLAFVLLFWRQPLSQLFFGNTEMDRLMLPLCLFLLGLALNGVVFGYYQGTLEMVRASALQSFNLALVPVVATVWLKSKYSIPIIVNTIGLAMCAGSCLFAWPIVRRWQSGVTRILLQRHCSELLSYGFSRILGDLGLQAMLSLPAVVAVHFFSIGSVSYLLLGGSFVTVVGAASMPLANILLSRVSRSIAQMRTEELRQRVAYFVTALMEVSVFICLQMVLFADVIVRTWVGRGFLAGIRIIQITILAVPFYFVYAGLRSVIDAAAVKAYNTRNIVISGGVFILALVLVKLYCPTDYLLEGLAGSGVLGLTVLAAFTLRTTRQLVNVKVDWIQVLPGVIVAACLGVLSWLFHQSTHDLAFMNLVAYELVLTSFYLAIMWMMRSSWLRFVWDSMVLPSVLRQGR